MPLRPVFISFMFHAQILSLKVLSQQLCHHLAVPQPLLQIRYGTRVYHIHSEVAMSMSIENFKGGFTPLWSIMLCYTKILLRAPSEPTSDKN
jgi:hypothetical protein